MDPALQADIRRRTAGLRRWLRSPKGNVVIVLTFLAAIAIPHEGVARAGAQLLAAIAVSMGVDVAFSLGRGESPSLPDGALISGLMVGLIIVPGAPLVGVIVASGLAASSKHILRVPQFHLFNPAALGLLFSLALLPAGQSWWGALSDLPAPFLIVLLTGGGFVAWRVNKLAAVLAFLGTYLTAFTLAAVVFGGSSPVVAAVFRPPFLNAALFFGLLMVTDPATSPNRSTDQLSYGAIIGVVSAGAFAAIHGLHYLFIGLLIGNAWSAWRRTVVGSARQPAQVLSQR
jgi:Na+-transporting NADH:ubiquinone oxidoreductase subunit NqrB